MRSVNAKAWETTPAVLRQLDGIGEKGLAALAANGFVTLDDVREARPRHLETILSRNPPFGSKLVTQAQSFPRPLITVETIAEKLEKDGVLVEVQVSIELEATDAPPVFKMNHRGPHYVTVLVVTSDQIWVEFRRIKASLLLEPKHFNVRCVLVRPSQKLQIFASCELIAGVNALCTWAPSTAPGLYPKPKVVSDTGVDPELLANIDEADFFSDGDQDQSSAPACSTEVEPDRKHIPATMQGSRSGTKKRTFTEDCLGDEQAKAIRNCWHRCGHKCKPGCSHLCCAEGKATPSRPVKSQRLKGILEEKPIKADNMWSKGKPFKPRAKTAALGRSEEATDSDELPEADALFTGGSGMPNKQTGPSHMLLGDIDILGSIKVKGRGRALLARGPGQPCRLSPNQGSAVKSLRNKGGSPSILHQPIVRPSRVMSHPKPRPAAAARHVIMPGSPSSSNLSRFRNKVISLAHFDEREVFDKLQSHGRQNTEPKDLAVAAPALFRPDSESSEPARCEGPTPSTQFKAAEGEILNPEVDSDMEDFLRACLVDKGRQPVLTDGPISETHHNILPKIVQQPGGSILDFNESPHGSQCATYPGSTSGGGVLPSYALESTDNNGIEDDMMAWIESIVEG